MKSCPIETAARHYKDAVNSGNMKEAAKYMKQYKEAIAATYSK